MLIVDAFTPHYVSAWIIHLIWIHIWFEIWSKIGFRIRSINCHDNNIKKRLATTGKCFPESLDWATQREVLLLHVGGKKHLNMQTLDIFLKNRNCCQTISDNFLISGRNNNQFWYNDNTNCGYSCLCHNNKLRALAEHVCHRS